MSILYSIHTCHETLTSVELRTVTLKGGATLGAVKHNFYNHDCLFSFITPIATELLGKSNNR